MRLTSVELYPANSSEVAVLSFKDPRHQNPYNVKAISGLDADEIVPRYYKGSDGGIGFYDLSLLKREIVARIGLNPRYELGESYSGLRDSLYKLISSSRTGLIQMRFKNGANVIAAVSGFVTKLSSPQFEKTQEVQITINCTDSMLRALDRIAIDISDFDPGASIIQDELSTASHGFVFSMRIDANMGSIVITDPTDARWTFTVTPTGGFLENDILNFSSEYNYKYLNITRGVDTISLADVIELGSVWPILFPGDNTFLFNEDGSNLTWVSASHFPTYWGV